MRCKLDSLRLKDGNSAQEHIKVMIKLFDALSVAGEAVKEDWVVCRLPESYNVLMTAIEANKDVPKLEVGTEHILNQEHKFK